MVATSVATGLFVGATETGLPFGSRPLAIFFPLGVEGDAISPGCKLEDGLLSIGIETVEGDGGGVVRSTGTGATLLIVTTGEGVGEGVGGVVILSLTLLFALSSLSVLPGEVFVVTFWTVGVMLGAAEVVGATEVN